MHSACLFYSSAFCQGKFMRSKLHRHLPDKQDIYYRCLMVIRKTRLKNGNVVPDARDEQMVTAAKMYNPSVKFTVYPDANHNSWERTYNNDSVYEWLL